MKIRVATILILNIFSFEFSLAAIGKKVNSSREKMYLDFCSEKISNSYGILDGKQIVSAMIYALTKSGQVEHFELAIKTTADIERASEVDRLISANILMMARDSNLERIKKLISFKSADHIHESYRIYFNGLLDIYLGDFKGGFNQIKSAIRMLPYIDEGMLLSLYFVSPNVPSSVEEVRQYSQSIRSLSDNNALKYLLQANELLLLKGWEAGAIEISDLIQRAYELCPNDADIALSYAALLESKLQTEAAKDIFLKLVDSHKYYNPEIDIRLMLYYFDKKDIENTELYLNKVKKSYLYLSEHNRKAIAIVEQSLAERPSDPFIGHLNFFSLNGLIFTIVTVLSVIVLVRSYLSKKQKSE